MASDLQEKTWHPSHGYSDRTWYKEPGLNTAPQNDTYDAEVNRQHTSQAAHLRQPCVNSHRLSEWEPVIFDHAQNRHPDR